jgi:DNA-directed RNA polymerase subunit RPC12/RpoP
MSYIKINAHAKCERCKREINGFNKRSLKRKRGILCPYCNHRNYFNKEDLVFRKVASFNY